jgi:CheY-like chemotaxis protein
MARILLAEDEVLTRFTLSHWLRAQGHEVLEAASGDEAITVLGSVLEIDLVVTDIEMPGRLDGLGLARHVREMAPGLPVIVVSGRPVSPEIEAVSVAFFRKPYDLDRIAALIARLVPPRDGLQKAARA